MSCKDTKKNEIVIFFAGQKTQAEKIRQGGVGGFGLRKGLKNLQNFFGARWRLWGAHMGTPVLLWGGETQLGVEWFGVVGVLASTLCYLRKRERKY